MKKNRYARILSVFAGATAIALVALNLPAVSAVADVTPAQGASSPAPPGPYPVLSNYNQASTPAAVQNWETNAEQQVAAVREVPDDLRNQLWSRGEIAADMYMQLVRMATESNPSPDDSTVVNWFAGQVTANQEAVATQAQDLYNQWHSNPCDFQVPVAPGYALSVPSGYQDSYAQSVAEFCEVVTADPASCVISGACTPSPPTAAEFTAWAAEYIQQENIVTWGNELLNPANATAEPPATDVPTTVAQAQGQAQKEYDGSYNDLDQGFNFLSATGSELTLDANPTPAQSEFDSAWDSATSWLDENAGHQFSDTLAELLSIPFDTSGDESSWVDDIVEGAVVDSAESVWSTVSTVAGIAVFGVVVLAVGFLESLSDTEVPVQLQDLVTQYQSTADLSSLLGTDGGQQMMLQTLIGLTMPSFTLDRAAAQYSASPAQPGPTVAADPAFYINGSPDESNSFQYTDWEAGQDETASVSNGWFVQGPISSGDGPYPYANLPSINFMEGPAQGPTAAGVEDWRAWLWGDQFLAERVSVSAGPGYVYDNENTCPGSLLPQGNVDSGAICVTADHTATTDGWSVNSAPTFGVNIAKGNLVSIGGQVRQVASVTDNSSGNTVAFTTTAPFGDYSAITGDAVQIMAEPDPEGCDGQDSLYGQVTGPDCVLTKSLTMLTTGASDQQTVTLTAGGQGKANPGLSLVAPGPVLPGQTFQLSVASDLTSSDAPVTITDGNGQFVCSLPSAAGCPVTESNSGTYTFTATFAGDSTFLPASASASVLVGGDEDATTTTLTASSSSSAYGSPVTFNVTVNPANASTYCPSGTVTFLDGTTVLGSTSVGPATGGLVVGGAGGIPLCSPDLFGGQGPTTGSFTTSSLPAGIPVADHEITAVYQGDFFDTGSTSSPVDVQVSQASSTVSIPNPPPPTTYGQPVTLTASTSAPSGEQMQFMDVIPDGKPLIHLGDATVENGTATFTIPSLPAGQHTIRAYYPGDANLSGSDALVDVTVDPAPLTITASDESQTYGGSPLAIQPGYEGFVNGDTAANLDAAPECTSTATAASSVGSYTSSCSGAADPNYTFTYKTGTVTVTPASLAITASDGTQAYGGSPPAIQPSYSGFVNGDKAASLTAAPNCTSNTTAASPVGSYASSCSGAADPNYTITYNTGTVTVTPVPLAITASSATQVYGAPAPAIQPSYSGFVNGDKAASLTTAPNCTSNTTAASPAGSYASSCSGAVDPNYTITYNTGTVTVTKAATAISLGSSLNPSMTGQKVTITATVAPAYSGAPTGSVTFSDGTSTLGTAALSTSNGVTTATFTTTGLSLGAHSITAAYGGDSNFNPGSTTSALTQHVDTSLTGYPTLPSGAYNLSDTTLKGAYLPAFNLSGASLSGSNFTSIIFAQANLTGANMSNSNLTGANLTAANLTNANLTSANLKNAVFTGANLTGANLTGANLLGATGLSSATLSNVTWSKTECPDGTLSNQDGGTCQGHF